MTRVDLVPENQFGETIQKLKVDLIDLKTAQPSGGDSNKIYLLTTPDAYDITGSATAGAWYSFSFAFNYVHQDFGYTQLIGKIYMDGTAPANLRKLGDTGVRDFYSTSYPPTTIPKRQVWQMGIWNDDSVSHTYYIKLYYLSTDSGFTV